MDAVLGLSVTPSAVGLVLVEGQDADGATVDGGAFEIRPRRRSTPLQTCEQAAAAVRRSEAIAATHGHRLHSIGVTWSDDADAEASLLIESLVDSGFDNVVPVRMPEATEALAWGIAEVIGHEITAVCLVEPDSVIALVVHTREGAVQTAVNRAVTTEEDLVRWLSSVFTRADWRPEALVVVGSGGALDELMPRLEGVLGVPVYAPAEAELALARGAALASAHSTELMFTDTADRVEPRPRKERRKQMGQAGPLAMLVAGAVTFVISVSVAVSLEITPDKAPLEPRPAAKSSPEAASAVRPAATAVPIPIGRTPAAPPPELSPETLLPPPVGLPDVPPDGAVEVPVSEATPPIEGVPPVDGAPPVEGLPTDAGAPPADGALPAPPPDAPPPPPEQVTAVPTEQPTLRERIKDRLTGRDDEAAMAPAPPPDPVTEIPGAPPLPPA